MESKQTHTLQQKLGGETNPFHTYRRSVVGTKSYFHLIIYEIINCTCIPLKGRIGILFRKLTLRFILGGIGKKVHFGANCTIRNGDRIIIGDQTVIENDVTLHLDSHSGDNRIVIEDSVHIDNRTIIKSSGGIMNIGNTTKIGSLCRIGSFEGLTIGHHCRIGNEVSISAASHSFFRSDIPINQQPLTCKGSIAIGNNVAIGDCVTILDGVHIGNNVTVLPGSLVNKNIEGGLTVSGVPARVCH